MRIVGVIPDDFVSIVSCELVMVPDTTETITVDFVIGAVANGEGIVSNDVTSDNMTFSATIQVIDEWNLLTANGGSSILPTVAAGDYIGFRMDSDTTKVFIVGIKFVYVRT